MTTLTPFKMWDTPSRPNLNVVGESHYRDHLLDIVARAGIYDRAGNLDVLSYVMAEPDNSWDRNACAVWIDGGRVGYLPWEMAAEYSPWLLALAESGLAGFTPAVIRWIERDDGMKYPGVVLRLGEPERLVPINQAHRNCALIPGERPIKVILADNASEIVGGMLSNAKRRTASVWTALERADAEGRAKPGVLVCVDGHPIGRLSPQASGKVLPIIDRITSAERIPSAHGVISGNALACEASVTAAYAADLSAEQVEDLTT